MNKDLILTKAATYFMDDPVEPINYRFMVLPGFTKGDDRIIVNESYSSSILRCISDLENLVNTYNTHQMIKLSNTRTEVVSYKERSVFESIVNAIAHHDYSLTNTEIKVVKYINRLEITSPGKINQIDNLDKTFDLQGIITMPRNEIICNILSSLKYIEQSGNRFNKITKDYENEDLAHKPYILAKNNQFTVTLPDLNYKDGINIDDMNLIYVPIKDGSKYDNQILSICYSIPKSAGEIASELGISNSTYLRDNILKKLVDANLLKISQKARSKVYYVNTLLVKR